MKPERTDLYAILGLTPKATQSDITHAYRALVRRHHPDTRSPSDRPNDTTSDNALQQVLAAYIVLGDPRRRASYDQQEQIRTINAAPPAPQRRWQHHDPPDQPPIQAGPVRWHTSPHPGR